MADKTAKEIINDHIKDMYLLLEGTPQEIENFKNAILAAMEEFAQQEKREANKFICDIAKLLGEDGLGYDDLTWTIEDFKNAIEQFASQPLPEGTVVWVEKDAVKEPPEEEGKYFVYIKHDNDFPQDDLTWETGLFIKNKWRGFADGWTVVSYLSPTTIQGGRFTEGEVRQKFMDFLTTHTPLKEQKKKSV